MILYKGIYELSNMISVFLISMTFDQIKLGAILRYLNLALSTIIGLTYTPFMLRTMGPSEYALYTIALTIVSYLNLLDFGFATGTIRYLSYNMEKNEYSIKQICSTSFILYCIIGFISFCLGLLLYLSIDKLYGDNFTPYEIDRLKIIVLTIVVYISINFPLTVFISIVTAFQRFVFIQSVKILSTILLPIVMLPLLIYGYKSVALSYVMVLLGGLSSSVFYFYSRNKLKIRISFNDFNLKFLKELFLYSNSIFVIMFADSIYRGFGQFYVGSITSTFYVATYSLAVQIKGYIESFIKVISSFFLPKLSYLASCKDGYKSVVDTFNSVSRIQTHIGIIIITGFILIGEYFIEFWAGSEYEDLFSLVLIISVPLIFALFTSIGEEILKAYKLQKYQMYIYLLRGVIVVLLSISLSKKLSYFACAISVMVSTIICDLFLMNLVYQKLLKLPVIKFLKSIKLSIIFSLCYIFIVRCFHNNFEILSSFMVTLIFIFLYSIICLNNREKNFIRSIIRRNLYHEKHT